MIVCKLCLSADNKMSRADRNLCLKCHKELTKYRRTAALHRGALEPYQLAFMVRMENTFKRNKSLGKFVPRNYTTEFFAMRCVTCDKQFESPTATKICMECRRMENAYRSLMASNPSSQRLPSYEQYYAIKLAQGMHVPKLYIDTKGTP